MRIRIEAVIKLLSTPMVVRRGSDPRLMTMDEIAQVAGISRDECIRAITTYNNSKIGRE